MILKLTEIILFDLSLHSLIQISWPLLVTKPLFYLAALLLSRIWSHSNFLLVLTVITTKFTSLVPQVKGKERKVETDKGIPIRF